MYFFRVLALCISLLLAGCYTSGISYKQDGVNSLTPLVSTYEDALLVMGGDPVDVYPRPDGSKWALWYFSRALLPDAIYAQDATMLEFNPDNRFVRVVPYAR